MDQDQAPRWGALPEEEGDPVEGSDARPKTSFFQRWMGREAFKAGTHEEDESEENSKKKRFSSLFKELFPSIARKESTPETSEAAPKSNLLAEFLLANHPEPTTEQKPAVNTEQLSFDPEGTLHINHPQPEIHNVRPAEVAPAPDLPPPVFAERSGFETPQPIVPPAELAVPAQQYAKTEQLRPQLSKPESPMEQKAGIAGTTSFFMSEFMSRRRHRKLKKEIQELKKLSTKLEKELATKAKNEILQQTSIGSEVITRSPVAEKSPTFQPTQEQAPVVVAPIILEKTSKASTPEKQRPQDVLNIDTESYKQEVEPKTAEKQDVTDINSTELFLKKREKDLEKLRKRTAQNEADSGESKNDIRRDRDFDRRHEVMDEPSTKATSPVWFTPPVQFALASSIADVLREKKASPAKQFGAISDSPKQSTKAAQPSLYQQSAQYGIFTGLAVVVFAVMAYFLF